MARLAQIPCRRLYMTKGDLPSPRPAELEQPSLAQHKFKLLFASLFAILFSIYLSGTSTRSLLNQKLLTFWKDPIMATPSESLRLDQFVMFGDSITQQSWTPDGGSGAALSDYYQRKLDVVNRGFSGYNTDWARFVISHILPLRENVKNGKESMIKIFTLWFGANDAVLEDRPQHVPIDRYKDNLKFFISQLRSEESPYYSPDTTIIVVTPPPIDEGSRRIDQVRKWGEHCTKDRSWEVTQQYAQAAIEVAKSFEGVLFVDIWTAVTEAANRENNGDLNRYLSDGLHLTGDGYRVVTNALIGEGGLIPAQAPHLLPDSLLQAFPPWDQIDTKNPAASFPPNGPMKRLRFNN